MVSLKDKVIIMTGASGGIGGSTAKLLAAKGAKVVIGSNDVTALQKLEGEIKAQKGQVVSMELDVTSEDQVKAFIDLAQKTYGTVDILINFAGLTAHGAITDLTEAQFDTVMDVNVKGVFLATKHFVPLVDIEKGAQIINFGSMASKRPNAFAPQYCAAKAAVNLLSQGLALQLKDKNIKVTTLNPGPTNTTFFAAGRPVPREKFMEASDVAEVIEFILTRESRVVFHDVAFESHLFFK